MNNNNAYSKTNKYIKEKKYFIKNMNWLYKPVYESSNMWREIVNTLQSMREKDQLKIMAYDIRDNPFSDYSIERYGKPIDMMDVALGRIGNDELEEEVKRIKEREVK